MGFGFSKGFVVFLALAIIMTIATKNIWNGVGIMIPFVIIKVVWKLLTK